MKMKDEFVMKYMKSYILQNISNIKGKDFQVIGASLGLKDWVLADDIVLERIIKRSIDHINLEKLFNIYSYIYFLKTKKGSQEALQNLKNLVAKRDQMIQESMIKANYQSMLPLIQKLQPVPIINLQVHPGESELENLYSEMLENFESI